ncbi:MAG: hypothetical protein NZ850_09365 [Caldimicrobium sp.]|nr:hypothetical protein [Caldimicrobium sp.]
MYLIAQQLVVKTRNLGFSLKNFFLTCSLADSRSYDLLNRSVEIIICTLKQINENVDEAIRKAHLLFRALGSLKESCNFEALSPEEKKKLLIETITQLKTN